jgi:hypothetical protein
MSFTTVSRLKDLLGRDGSGKSVYGQPTENTLGNARDYANGQIAQMGVPTTETDLGLLGAADKLALGYIVQSQIVRAMLNGNIKAAGSMRILASDLDMQARSEAVLYIPLDRRKPVAPKNRNWAAFRGGPLHRDSEAGRFNRRNTR